MEMNYEQAVDYISSLGVFGMKPGLSRLSYLLSKMGNPQKKLKFIHIAGTNGKGSTSAMTANVLKTEGYQTGLFISPFVLCFRERMQINGEMIPEDELADCTAYVKQFVDEMRLEFENPTQFELETAIAFEWFLRQSCDIVCLEVGLGGRFDATNVIDPPILQVITAISLDHTAILGDSLEQIAFEKAGILKGAPTVLYPLQAQAAEQVIRRRCQETHSTLMIPDVSKLKILDDGWMKNRFCYEGKTIQKSLPGLFQVYNAVTVCEIVKALNEAGIAISDKSLCEGIRSTVFPARMEIVGENPLVILDGAHNPAGIEALEETLKQFKNQNINILMGMLSDKDYETALRVVARYAAHFIAVTPPSPRALSGLELSEKAAQYCKTVFYRDDFHEAVSLALQKTEPDDVLIVCGSLYLVSAIRPIIIHQLEHGSIG